RNSPRPARAVDNPRLARVLLLYEKPQPWAGQAALLSRELVMVAIETEGLTKTFTGRHGSVEAVRGVSMRVAEGEVFGFLGPNGAGKTTTMRMLATLLAPTSGRAVVAGADLLRAPTRVRERIGYAGQVGGAERSSTAREDLVLQGRL